MDAPATPHGNTERATTFLRAMWLVAAAIVLLIPGAQLLFGEIQSTSRAEKRPITSTISARPDLIDLKPFRSATEAFIRDQFAFRDVLFRVRTEIALAFGISTTRPVLIGRNGWMFIDFNGLVHDLRGYGHLDSAKADRLAGTLTRSMQEIEGRGIPFVFGIAPNKASIYPEFLPRWLTPVPRDQTNLARLMSKIRDKTNLASRTVDLTGPLRAARQNGVLYYRKDTHWNALGAFFAYRALTARLARRLPGLKPIARHQLRFVSAPHLGDLTRMTNPWGRPNSVPNQQPRPLGPWRPFSFRFFKADGARLRGRIVTRSPARKAGPQTTLLIIGDSFANGLVVYFSQEFDRVVVVHHELGGWPRGVLDRFKPTAVILIMVQRFLADYVQKP